MSDIMRILDKDPKEWTEKDHETVAKFEKHRIFIEGDESTADIKVLQKQIKGLEETNKILVETLKETLSALEHIHNNTKEGWVEVDFMIEDDIKLAKKAIKKVERVNS